MKEKNGKTEKSLIRKLFEICPVRHILCLPALAVIVAQAVLKNNYAVMNVLSRRYIRPLHSKLAGFSSGFSFSLAEALIGFAVILAVVYLLAVLVLMVTRGKILRRLYKLLVTAVTAVLVIYAGFCVLWGVYYYGDDFSSSSGLVSTPVSVEELKTVTNYFAKLANDYSAQVPRDENGVCCSARDKILNQSDEVFRTVISEYPFLDGPAVEAKGVFFSEIMSLTDFTGFFFPFTGEANVNTHFPVSLFASTVAHELSHQRGVAQEQQANFVAVMASLKYGDPDYCYSAALLAYTHLGNALYSADKDAWRDVYSELDENVIRDFNANREYWKKYETPVQTVSNVVYENFLYSYDQNLGLKSYGACVDLLVNYYYDEALNYFTDSDIK